MDVHAYYENMSSEIQKAARSEVIFVGYRSRVWTQQN